MQAIRTLPENYITHHQLDLSRPRAALLLNLAALPFLALFAWLFHQAAVWLRPEFGKGSPLQAFDSLIDLLLLIAAYVAMIILHELVHGLFFWVFTKEQPTFAFKGVYAYAAAPDWYIPRNQYILVGLAPLVFISIIALLLIVVAPVSWVPLLSITAALNAAGAIGDIFVVGWIFKFPTDALVRDRGDAFEVFLADKASA